MLSLSRLDLLSHQDSHPCGVLPGTVLTDASPRARHLSPGRRLQRQARPHGHSCPASLRSSQVEPGATQKLEPGEGVTSRGRVPLERAVARDRHASSGW
jgi:hypothetical protein